MKSTYILIYIEQIKGYSFGYKRAEAIGSMINAILIWVLTIYLVIEAGKRILHPPKYF